MDRAEPKLLASTRHTLILILIMLAVAAVGFFQINGHVQSQPSAGQTEWPIYAGLLAAEWGLFLYLRSGLRRAGTSIPDVISRRGWSLAGLAVDMVLGLALVGVWVGVEFAWSHFFSAPPNAATSALKAQSLAYLPLWIALSMSAGFVEELIYRGYLQQQFAALTRSPIVAIGLQAILFGISHGYQGVEPVIRITAFGLLFGIVAEIRRSTRPGMLAHAIVDIAAAFM